MGKEADHSLEQLHERDAGRCWLCYTYCPIEQATRDHVIPVSMGGAYAWANFALAHEVCNHQRGDRFPVARYKTFRVSAQQRAWNRSGGRCERCGIGSGLILDQPPWATDVAIKCTDCRFGATAYRNLLPAAPKGTLSMSAAEVLPADAWDQLLKACVAEQLVPTQGHVDTADPQADPQQDAVVDVAADPAQDLAQDLVQPEPQPFIPAPRPKPRFTPDDHRRQAERARAAAAEREAALAAQQAPEQAPVAPEPVLAGPLGRWSWIVRAWRRVAFWRG